METALIECDVCGRSHRSEEAVHKCAIRAERALALANKRLAEKERRVLNLARESVRDYVLRRLREGGQWVNMPK